MKTRNRLFSILLVVSLLITSYVVPNGSAIVKAEDEKPYFMMVCMSDLHNAESVLQSETSDIRSDIITTVEKIREQEEQIDAVAIGGDVTSGAQTSEYNLYRILDLVQDRLVTLSTNTFWITGNHDFNAGEANYNSADYFYEYVQPFAGPVATDDDLYIEESKGKEYVCGYHYTINNCEIICLLNPYDNLAGNLQSSNYVFTDGTFDWLDDTLFRVTEDPYRPVFVVGHFPLRDTNSIYQPDKGLSEECDARMKDVLTKYRNIYYLYGHDHGRTERAYIHDRTEQRVTEYDEYAQVMNPENPPEEEPEYGEKSFTAIFMGSLNYYNSNFQGFGVVQALMVYVYKDRIEFAMKNYGPNAGGDSYEIEPYIVYDIPVRPDPTPTPEPPAVNNGNDSQNNPANTSQNPQAQNQQPAQNQPSASQPSASQISLKKAAVSSFKVGKNGKKAVVKIKKLTGAEGYQIQIGTDKKFKKKAIYDKYIKSLNVKIKKLKKSKKYFVRVRGYVTSGGKKVYGAWSAAKKSK